MADAVRPLAVLSLHLVLTGLPIVAAMLLAASLGVRRTPLLLAIGLAASGLVAILAFWVFYASPLLGRTFGYLVAFGSLALVVACLRGGRIEKGLVKELAVPLALWGLASAFITCLGFLHGGINDPLGIATTRFSGQLPSDNVMPSFFADWFFHHGHNGTPPEFPGEWLASDRPPLQVGYLLAERGFGWDDTGLHGQLVGVVVQQLWVLGLWVLLLAGGVGRRARGLAMAAALVSDLVIVHGFYVWPKLLPAAFLIAAAALLLSPGWAQLRRDWRGGALVGGLVSLALLAHGASIFGLAPLMVFAAAAGFPDRRWFGAAVLVGAVLLLPWAAYQKYGDPPGNRLTKWMLGGVERIDNRGTVETIVDGYREAGLGGTLDNKWRNVTTMTGDSQAWDLLRTAAEDAGRGDWRGTVEQLRWLFFFYLFPSLGLLLLAPVVMAVARLRGHPRGSEWRLSLLCWAAVLAGCVVWGLLMFGGPESNASIHVGTLAIPLLAIAASVLGLHAVLPRFALWWVGLWMALTLALYAPALTPLTGTSYSVLAALGAALSLAAFLAVAFGLRVAASEPANTLARR